MRLIDNLSVSPNKIAKWIDNYYDWLDFTGRSTEPMSHNLDNLHRAQYHQELGRGGYFAPECGTSEGQFLSILGYIYMYETTKNMKWLGLAEKSIDGALLYLYKDQEFPKETFDKYKSFAPNWLFCVSKPYVSEAYYLDKVAHFANGEADLSTQYEARKVFQVVSMDAEPLWDDPYASLKSGHAYTVDSFAPSGNSLHIKLDESYTGDLKVFCSDMGGPEIEVSEACEAYPIWRPLKEGEVACACDSLWWSYHCWVKMYELTGSERYRLLIKHTQALIKYASSIVNANAYFFPVFLSDDVLSIPGIFYDNYGSDREVDYSRDSNDGSIKIAVPAGNGLFGMGAGFDLDTKTDKRYYELDIKTDLPTPVWLKVICPDPSAPESPNMYTLWKWTEGTGQIETLRYDLSAFKNTNDVYFDLEYEPHQEFVYKSDHSSYSFSTARVNGELARVVTLHVGTEQDDSGHSFAGWCQYFPTQKNVATDNIPPITYQQTGCIDLVFTDDDGWLWVMAMPKHKEMSTEIFDKSDATFYEYQTKDNPDTLPAGPAGQVHALMFYAVSFDATLTLLRIGDLHEKATEDVSVKEVHWAIEKAEEQTIKLYSLRPLPIDNYPYNPYVMPFTFNIMNGALNNWRGTPYVGYQSPWFWQDLSGDEGSKGLSTNLRFVRDAQINYMERFENGHKFFTPVFIWDREDNLGYGSADTWTWVGPDPNTAWGGYQYRAIEAVAYALYREPTNKIAARIVYDFLASVDTVWTGDDVPATFNVNGSIDCYYDVNALALLMRAAVFALESEQVAPGLCLSLINKCLSVVNAHYVDPVTRNDYNQPSTLGTFRGDGVWYQFHGGEMLHALAWLLKFVPNQVHVQSLTGELTIDTLPDGFTDQNKDYAKVKTPIGPQNAELVAVGDPHATNLIIQTNTGPMALKGAETMSTYDLELLQQNTGKTGLLATLREPMNIFYRSQIGALAIHRIRGVPKLTNISPRRSYDCNTGLYSNLYFLQPNKTYSFACFMSGTTSLTWQIQEGKMDGSTSTPEYLNSGELIKPGDRLNFTFTTSANHQFVQMFPNSAESAEDTIMNDIMVFETSLKVAPTAYIAGSSYGFTNAIVMSVKNSGTLYSDTFNLADYVPSNLLPLRCMDDGTVFDEVIGKQVIKRLGSDGSTLSTPQITQLDKPLPLFSCGQDAWVTLESGGLLPAIDVLYPVLFSDAYGATRDNINPIVSSKAAGELMLGGAVG